MFKLIFFSTVVFSSASFANINGVWSGDLSINGKACKPTSIEITETANSLAVYAALDENGNHALECGPRSYKYYMWLEEDYLIKNNELWRNGVAVGTISPDGILAKDGSCEQNQCEYWDYIKINKLTENKISIWIDFNGAILTGEISRN